MKILKGTIKSDYRTEVQRVEGRNQAPQFLINDKIYYAYKMKESFVTAYEPDEHHTLDAIVIFTAHQETPVWYNLHLDFSSNEWTLTETSDPEEV